MRFNTLKFFLLRILAVISGCDSSKDGKFVDLTEEMMLFITASSKGGVLEKFEGQITEYPQQTHVTIQGSKLDVLTDVKSL